MANLDLIVIENGRRKRKPSQDQTIDFTGVRIGASLLPITENSGAFDFGNKELTNVAQGTGATALVTKAQMESYVGSAAIQGGVVKQQLLTQQQLDDTLGILPGTVFYLSAQPTANDTITFKDASANTETWTFVASRSGANEVTIGADAAESMSNLATAIMTDSSYWKAYYDANALDDLYADGLIGVYREAIEDFYLYVTQTGGTIAGVVANFSAEEQYKTDPTAIAIPTSDPGASTVYSGFKIAKASLDNGEIHNVLAEDKVYSWNADFNEGAGEWFILAEGAVTTATAASGGGVLGKITADSDKGLSVTAGVLSVNISSTYFEFSTGAIAIKGGAIGSTELAATSVTAAKLNADVISGDGLSGADGSAISLAFLATTSGTSMAVLGETGGLHLVANSTQFQESTGVFGIAEGGVGSTELAATSVTAAKLNADIISGDGLSGADGSAISLAFLATTSGTSMAVLGETGGLHLVANSTQFQESTGVFGIAEGGVGSTELAGTSVTAAKLGSDVAGSGLTGGNGSAIDVNAGTAIKIDTDAVAVDFAATKTNDNAGAITIRQIVYVKADGDVDLAQANVSNLDTFELGIVEDASIDAAASGKIILRRGAIVGGFSGLTPGMHLYVSRSTAGAYQQNLTGFVAGEFVYSVGRAISATEVLYNPEFMFEY